MVLLNLYRSLVVALALYVMLGVALNHWVWTDILVFFGVTFAAFMASEAGEALLVKVFNREPQVVTREGYRNGY